MSRFVAEPHRLLRPYVQTYWGFVRDFSPLRSFTVTPDCFVELIFFVDPPWVEHAGGLERLPVCTLIPLLSKPLRLVMNGLVRCASIRLHPWAAGIIFPQANALPMQAWYDICEPFADTVLAVTDALNRAAWSEMSDILDGALLRAFAGAQSDVPAYAAVNAFVSRPGATSAVGTQDVATRQGFSRRQVERQVRSLTNRSPKQLVCLSRFQFVRDTLWARPDTPLHRLALEAGYADQAHLTRHFRRYAGGCPTAFKRSCAELKALLKAQDVAFVQDGVPRHAYAQTT